MMAGAGMRKAPLRRTTSQATMQFNLSLPTLTLILTVFSIAVNAAHVAQRQEMGGMGSGMDSDPCGSLPPGTMGGAGCPFQ
jgi:hypothetical protein